MAKLNFHWLTSQSPPKKMDGWMKSTYIGIIEVWFAAQDSGFGQVWTN